MCRIARVVLVLFTAMVFAGCAANPQGKVTGIPFIVSEYDKMRQRQNTLTVRSIVKNNANPEGQTARPVTVHFPAAKGMDNTNVTKKVYLTFDDGPEVTITPAVLDILDSYGVKATFFVIGTCVEKNPGILKEIVKRGHSVGNHTYNHKYSDLYSVNGGFIKSLKINGELIYRTVGLRPYIVRDPGGKVRNKWPLRKTLGENNYWLIEWNVDSYDSRKPSITPPQIIDNIRLQTKNPRIWSRTIILMHDGKGHINTLRALPTIIEMLKKDGFSFEVVK